MEKAYRYADDTEYAGFDEISGHAYSVVNIRLREFAVVKHTPKGFWIIDMWRYPKHRKFVLNTAHKKFAHLDKESALESFIRRKERQIDLAELQLSRAKNALAQAQSMKAVEPVEGAGG